MLPEVIIKATKTATAIGERGDSWKKRTRKRKTGQQKSAYEVWMWCFPSPSCMNLHFYQCQRNSENLQNLTRELRSRRKCTVTNSSPLKKLSVIPPHPARGIKMAVSLGWHRCLQLKEEGSGRDRQLRRWHSWLNTEREGPKSSALLPSDSSLGNLGDQRSPSSVFRNCGTPAAAASAHKPLCFTFTSKETHGL